MRVRIGIALASGAFLIGFGLFVPKYAALRAEGQQESTALPKTRTVFPPDNPWNEDISKLPTDPNSDAILRNVGMEKPLHPDFGTLYAGKPMGIPYILVAGNQPRVPVELGYKDESDLGDYPIPPNPPIEGGADSPGDKHCLIIDRDHWKLYELDELRKEGGVWHADSGAIFDLGSNVMRPASWTSADAAGLPIFPGLVRYDEVVERKSIPHALRFTVRKSRRAYVYPARHWASRNVDPLLPPMGMRVRLKASVDIAGFPQNERIILTCLKKYGMIVADNGADWFLSGAPDVRWNNEELGTLKRIHGSDFEVIRMTNVVAADK